MVATAPATRSPRRWTPAVIVALLVALAAVAPAALAQRTAPQASAAQPAKVAPSAPSPEHEAQFVSRINSLRASKGLSRLEVSGQLQGVARNWTERMVQNGQISHNPNLSSQVSGNWTKLGENVGVGYDVDGLMQAFVNSPSHYKNLVDPAWNYVGVGVTIGPDGRMYTTHNFMAMPSSAPPPPKAPATAPAPAKSSPTTQPRAAASPPTTAAPAPPPPPQPKPTPERVTAVLDPLRSLERG